MALEQLEIERDVEAVAEGIGDGLVGRDCLIFVSGTDANPGCVSVTRRTDALVLVISPLQGRLPEIAVTVEDVTTVDGHHLVAGDLDHSLLHDGAAQVLNHGPVRIFTIQRDSEGQAGGPRDDNVVRAEVRESNQQLLILINRAQVVCNHDGLPHSFDPQGLAEAPVRIKFLGLGTLAQRYGAGGAYAVRRSLGLPDYRSGASRGLGRGRGDTAECRGDPPEKH